MSVSQPPYSAGAASVGPGSNTPPVNNHKDKPEDCRDYLRTGRCKYGASCKYYHPPNVQSGGGMKTPLDPSEPMFPIRPNEPVCQYFMKHGTCKFGQACKFHHPPTAQQPHYAAVANGTAPVLYARKVVEPATQLVAVGPPGAELTHMMVQFLPQRPEEPDCIYFLKNGRCKYGATCRYHHPIHPYSQPRPQRHPRNPHSEHMGAKRIPYSTPQAGISHPPGHIMVSEGGPVSFVSIEQPGGAAYCKPVTYISSSGEVLAAPQATYGVTTGSNAGIFSGSTVMTEQASSASSIASSFDTASSSHELTGSDAATAALWSRARKNGSGGSLSAFDKARGTTTSIPSVASDGNIARRAHSNSLGSAAEGDYQPSYAEGPPPGPPAGWRHRSSSFDQQTKRSGNRESYVGNGDPVTPESHEGVAYPVSAGRPPMLVRGGRHRQSRGPGGDEGFTMMTSALLNMLDTQEETPAEILSEDEGSYMAGARLAPPSDGATLQYVSESVPQEAAPTGMMGQLSLNHSYHGNPRPPPGMEPERQGSGSRWTAPDTNATEARAGGRLGQQHMSKSHHPGQGGDLGLYLP